MQNELSEKTPRASYDELNGMTLTPGNQIEKLSTVHTEKYDVEQGQLETVDRVKTSNALHMIHILLQFT